MRDCGRLASAHFVLLANKKLLLRMVVSPTFSQMTKGHYGISVVLVCFKWLSIAVAKADVWVGVKFLAVELKFVSKHKDQTDALQTCII